MKEFIVTSKDKEYKVKANDFRSAVKAIKAMTVKDEASQLDVIQALVTDEHAAIAAYANAIKNLNGKVDQQYIEVLRNILKEENKHVENLQAIVTGNVTEKNVEDSVKDYSRKDFGKVFVSTMKRFGSNKEEVFINWYALGEVDIKTAERFAKDLTSAIAYAKSLKVR